MGAETPPTCLKHGGGKSNMGAETPPTCLMMQMNVNKLT